VRSGAVSLHHFHCAGLRSRERSQALLTERGCGSNSTSAGQVAERIALHLLLLPSLSGRTGDAGIGADYESLGCQYGPGSTQKGAAWSSAGLTPLGEFPAQVHSDWAVLGRGFSGAGAAVCSMKAAAPRLNIWSPGPARASTDPVRRQRSSPGRQHAQKVSLGVSQARAPPGQECLLSPSSIPCCFGANLSKRAARLRG
jgi:hypothetical protein